MSFYVLTYPLLRSLQVLTYPLKRTVLEKPKRREFSMYERQSRWSRIRVTPQIFSIQFRARYREERDSYSRGDANSKFWPIGGALIQRFTVFSFLTISANWNRLNKYMKPIHKLSIEQSSLK